MTVPSKPRCGLALALALAAGAAACRPSGPQTQPKPGAANDRDALTISVEQQASWVRNFNPFMTGKYRWPTIGPIYEPLLIYSTAKSAYQPWLATSHAWGEGYRSVRFTLREGVRWSDGKPFTSADVLFTFNLVKAHKALDQAGIWGFVSTVTAPSAHEVVFEFERVFVPGLAYIAQHPIVAAHAWARVDDPTTFANPEPIGTGPFTKVARFQNQIFELTRNPYYWQQRRPKVARLRFPAISSNEQAMLALLKGDLDWAGNFIPDIQRVFVTKDPEHHGYWYPLIGSTVFLYANTTRAPFDDVRVRKALSMAISRQQIAEIAMNGYTRPADATGLSDAHKDWRDPEVVAGGDWVEHDVDRANQLLDEAGYRRGKDGIRRGKDGRELSYQINVVSGWSDWVRACQVMANNLQGVGVRAAVKAYDFAAWFDRVQTGDFDLSIGWSSDGVSPYFLYRDIMSSATVKPSGERTAVNWQRFGLPEADELLRQFESTGDIDQQRAVMSHLQGLFSAHAPAIPLFPGPAWGVYNSRRFSGYPTAHDPYAVLSPNPKSNWQAEYMLVLAQLTPNIDDNSTSATREN
jgi:peptide/nickel transport system substrate-binding protein